MHYVKGLDTTSKKLCSVHIHDMSQTIAILNKKLKIQTQGKTQIHIKKETLNIKYTESVRNSIHENNKNIKTQVLKKRKFEDNNGETIPKKKIKKEPNNIINQNYQIPKKEHNTQIPLSSIIVVQNEHRNNKTFNTLKNDIQICNKFGYKFKKTCTVHINDITQTSPILNAKIQLQNKDNPQIFVTRKHNSAKTLPKNYQKNTKYKHIFLNKYSKAIKDNKLCEKYGYKFQKILFVHINKRCKQRLKVNSNTLSTNDKRHYGKTFEDSIQIFNTLTAEGPIYICTVCQQTNFKDKVTMIHKLRGNSYQHLFNNCKTNYKSIDNNEYICNTCKQYIYKNIIPKISIKNGCCFPNKPNELDLFNLEERYISPVMAFMLIHQLFPGGQLSLYGCICHLPIEIGKMVHTLPRTFDQYETISVKLKRRLCYKNTVFNENIRPHKILEALKYLLDTSELYKENNIDINPKWLTDFVTNNPLKNSKNKQTTSNEEEFDDENTDDASENENDDNQPNAPSVNTLLTDKNIDPDKNILCIAPAEGEKPIFTDPDTEYLCFPTIFCGQRRRENKYHKLTKREIFKYEMRSADRRVSTNIPNIFWKTKHKQINQIHQQASFALRRNQTKGQKITAKTLLNKETRENIVKYDDGYKIFKNVRSSPPYFEAKKKDLMAMIRQLGIPTLFISLSAADTKWLELLQSIYILTEHKNISLQQLDEMSWQEKCSLISKDPGTCALFFNNRVRKFVKHILKSPHSPFGKLSNYFYRVEFQHRGSPHIHGLLWIENAPHYEKDNDDEVIKYVDSIISCSRNTEHKKYIDLQIHKHSKTCIKKVNTKKQCRFGAPWPPLNSTQILYPLNKEEFHSKDTYSKLYNDINKFIQIKYKKKLFMEFNEMLTALNISYDKYILALRSTINKKKIFLKRALNEIYINNYMLDLISVWKANHDIQYVLDPYSCVVYICDYLMKNNKGMSKLLDSAAKEAKLGNMDLKQSVRHIGNKFLNCTEMSEQECAYSLLELPMTQSSIKIEFINTSEIQNRVFIAKPDHILEKMNPDSDNIKQMNNIDRYAQRPHSLKKFCLADFVSMTDTIYKKYISPVSDDEASIDENTSDEETYTDQDYNIHDLFPIKFKNIIIKLRKNRKVIRFVNYKYNVDPENYCREKLLLYIPWQKNEINILQTYETYIDAYNDNQKEIHKKMKIYEPSAKIIENALLEYEDHPESFLPASHGIIHETKDNIPRDLNIIDTEYNFLIPENENEINLYDLQEDMKIQKYNYKDSIQTKPNIFDYKELTVLINSLNLKQYQFFQYIMQQEIHKENNQTLVCLHGGAGTGKSYTLKAVYQGLNRILNNTPGQQTNDLTTLLIAPTGKAAHNIKGHTIHAAFHVPANQSLSNYTQLSWDNLNSYRSKYQNLKWIICDEISMVSNYMLKFIHLRLQEIKSNNLLFGGVNIIAVGDMFQLKPVMGQFVFENYKNDYGPLATNLWKENFKIYQLSDIMRQKDDKKFAELLNRLRTGTHSQNDIKLLKHTKTANKHLKKKESIPHFYPTLQQVHLHNENVSKKQRNFSIMSFCTDILPSSISEFLETNINAATSKRKITHTGGLPSQVILMTNEQYDLISNIDVEDGLINGAQCLIKYIETTTKSTVTYPYIVWVQFENNEIGSNYRKKYSYLYSKTTDRNLTPIIKIKRTFLVKNHWIHRLQFPLRQAAARSIHVSQSSTYPEIYVDLNTISTPPKVFWEHMHYVAFSRVTSLSGLYIEHINEKNIAVSQKVTDYLKSALETDKLDTEIDFTNKNMLNVLLHNSRSFKKHFDAIHSNKLILAQDINIFLESKLCKYDKSSNYSIEDRLIVRADQKNTTNPHYGIISFLKTEINILKVQYLSTEKIDTLYLHLTFKKQNVSIFAIYNSPKNLYCDFEKHIIPLIKQEHKTCQNIILAGDFNIHYLSNTYKQLCTKLSEYNLQQHVTKCTTINNSTIDYIFTNLEVHKLNIFYTHWSDHYIIQVQLKL